MRRVLHIIDSLNGDGAAPQLTLLARGLAEEGFQVQIAALGAAKVPLPIREGLGEGSLDAKPTIPITRLNRRAVVDPLAFSRLVRLIRRFRPEIVHTWNLDAAMYGGAALACWPQRWRRRSRALGMGADQPRLVVGLYRNEPWKPEWQRFFVRRVARHADQLVSNSPNVRDWHIARGWPVDNFAVLSAGVPASRLSDVSRQKLLCELRLPADARLIGVIGRLVPENRVKDLIWAADLLRVLHDNLRLLIIGDGPLRPQLEEYARLASDLDHIQFLGDRSDAWRITPHFDVLWSGGENVEVSTAILGAMAAGVPVIASDTPTNRQLVVDNETGYLIPLGTRAGRADRARYTDRVFNDAELAGQLSRAARQRATEKFCSRRSLTDYWDLYSKICV